MFVSKAVKSSLCLKNSAICEYLLAGIRVFALLERGYHHFTRPQSQGDKF